MVNELKLKVLMPLANENENENQSSNEDFILQCCAKNDVDNFISAYQNMYGLIDHVEAMSICCLHNSYEVGSEILKLFKSNPQ